VTAFPTLASEPVARPHGYEHLAPLFVERDELPDGHPRRRRLRDALIAGYRPVARHIARRYGYRGEPADDLEQVATLGLILAVDRFEAERGVDFLSFAVPTINGEVLRHLRDRSTAIRVPRRLRELQAQIYDAAATLGQRLGRAPRPSEIAAELRMDLELVLDGLAARAAAHCSSLDEPSGDDEGRPGDRTRLAGALKWTEARFDLIEQREALIPLLAALPERDRTILALRFFDGLTQTEIGQRVGISQMHVSRLLSRTLATLRAGLAAD
jgi:RNA polymerase sigma-B factor